MDEEKEPTPWGDFLDARLKCIFWLAKEKNRSDLQIALDLSLDEEQVYSIRTHPMNQEIFNEMD